METIKNFLSKLGWKDVIIIFLIMFGIRYYLGYNHYYNEYLTPTLVYHDSLSIYKNKIKEEYVSKDIYIQDVDQLKSENSLLAYELKNLKDNPLIITKTDIQFKLDTVFAQKDTIIRNDSIYNLEWYLADTSSRYNINGTTLVKQDFSDFVTRLNTLLVNANLTFDLLDNGDNKFRLIGKTDNPYIKILNMDGVVIDPSRSEVLLKYYKPKRWAIGPSVNVGVTTEGKLSPGVGISLTYGLIRF